MRTLCLACFLLASCALLAQPQAAPGNSHLIFEQRWPDSEPRWFELLFQPDGSARYRSLPHQKSPQQESKSPEVDPAPEPYEFNFTLSPHSRQFVFAVAAKLPRFQGSLDKIKVAFTGTKTLRYEDPTGNSSVLSYNYSSSPELTTFTELMQGISQSIELSQTLQFQLRFDKLALDSTLRSAEERVSVRPLPEPQILEPVLQRIANDPAVMNIARQRARHILQTPLSKPKY
jgi:hypothetical protein